MGIISLNKKRFIQKPSLVFEFTRQIARFHVIVDSL